MKILIAGVAALAVALLAPVPAHSDLQSFFHGKPPAVKLPPPKQLAVVSTQAGVPADPQVESFLRGLANAVKARDGALVLARLSADYAVEGLPEDRNPADFMAQAILQMPGPTQIVIRSVEPKGSTRVAKAEFQFESGKPSVKTFVFDANGNLLASDLFALVRG